MKNIRNSKFTRFLAIYLAMMLILEICQPMVAYALTEGPSQPEFNSFTPIELNDMVDLTSGDFNYNIPLVDVGGYPVSLAYNSGIGMDQEASWVGLGWNLNVGQINRNVRGIPDDFNGDKLIYENNLKDNITVGAGAGLFSTLFSKKENPIGSLGAGVGVEYNNYNGMSFSTNVNTSFGLTDNLSVGLSLNNSTTGGASINPNITFKKKMKSPTEYDNFLNSSLGVSYNNRKGVSDLQLNITTSTTRIEDKKSANLSSYSGKISFVNSAFTPSSRLKMNSTSLNFNAVIESEIYGAEGGTKFNGYFNKISVDDSEYYKEKDSYGYNNLINSSKSGVLDFNRENDRTYNEYSTLIAIPVQTYDLLNIQGQGIGGQYRAYNSQVLYTHDPYVSDKSHSGSLGLEFGAGNLLKFGFDASYSITKSYSGLWDDDNNTVEVLKNKNVSDNIDYESIFYKKIGGLEYNKNISNYSNIYIKNKSLKFKVNGNNFKRKLQSIYKQKNFNTNYTEIPLNESIKNKNRVNRNQIINHINREDAIKYGIGSVFSKYAKNHHTAEVQVTSPGGEKYIYGKALYNVIKKEATFDVTGNTYDCVTGLVDYYFGEKNGDNSIDNKRGGDRMFNRVTTPSYAHTYLLTNVLSSDFKDIDGLNGPSDGDLGTYTNFKYINKNSDLFKWRTPYARGKANYDEGLKADHKDQKGNYTYGEKEIVYLKEIETKTHVAIFEISEREDAHGVIDQNGGLSESAKSFKLDKIILYSKSDYNLNKNKATPIKTVHFEYDYSLCKGVDNNINNKGKLTLNKVYFTYQNSNMGKYTPYKFSYSNNYDYNPKAFDVWGNYKPTELNANCNATSMGLTNAEFPFVNQDTRELNNKYVSAWNLDKIHLPSGGLISITTESDDYGYVQDKEVMQMFKIIGAGTGNPTFNNELYNVNFNSANNYLYLKLNENINSIQEFKNRYIKDLTTKDIYFRFLVNMTDPNPIIGANTNQRYEYVTGYLQLDDDFKIFGNNVVALKIKTVNKSDGVNPNTQVNPISKAGWNFGRTYLQRLVYSDTNEQDTNNLESIILDMVRTVPNLLNIFKSPNSLLMEKGICSNFIANKSWIRLMQPNQNKQGGGLRVKKIEIHDNWDKMSSNSQNLEVYGQEYEYTLENGNTSGVATYEPLGAKDNPLVQPFYDNSSKGLLLGPSELNYVETPIGESYYPNPTVTYSRVSVKNLDKTRIGEDNKIYKVKTHGSGKVVTEHYTSKDYPTIVDFTTPDSYYDKRSNLGQLLNPVKKDYLTISQGFSINTNDMNGKVKTQKIYAENQNEPISSIENVYDYTLENGTKSLNNRVLTISKEGKIESKIIGEDVEITNDFRESNTDVKTYNLEFNYAIISVGIYVLTIPSIFNVFTNVDQKLNTAATVKHTHSTGILKEVIATDLGSKVSTKNLAYDLETGEVILTETVNEYDDKYYSFNYPAYWNNEYEMMGSGITNLNIEAAIKMVSNGIYNIPIISDNTLFFKKGDQVWVTQNLQDGFVESERDRPLPFKAWIVEVLPNQLVLIDKDGLRVDQFKLKNGTIKIIESGYRNLQNLVMASVTSMINPLTKIDTNGYLIQNLYSSNNWSDYRIINANAIEYSDIWEGQCECNLPKMKFDSNKNLKFSYPILDYSDIETDFITRDSYNPYLYNILGNWRPKKSYTYLTGRYTSDKVTPRVSGFYMSFSPFYTLNTQKKWNKADISKWTFASEISLYNPYGQEIENRDALNRYSSALFGYNNTLPLAVASNSRYKEIAFDGFEDYSNSVCDTLSHFNFITLLKDQHITIDKNNAHSGTNSLRIAPNSESINGGLKATLKKQIISCGETNNNSQTRTVKASRTK